MSSVPRMLRATRLRTAVSLAVILIAAAAWLVFRATPGPEASLSRRGMASLGVPGGFRVQKVAGTNLVSYPMLGTVDERGRLFLCESSGKTVKTPEMTADPTYQVSLLEDLNGDGVFDRTTVFADKLTLPAGAVWYRGSLYVAAPPNLYRFEDTDGDGAADVKQIVIGGWNLSANAASLHGPILGPDGWLYLTDGRHGYKIRTKEGQWLEGKASRIWRCRPDGTGLEWVSGGGFDNPVEVVFTPAGEMIGTMTYFTDPRDGQRDALLHFVEGGVYPKPHPVTSEFKRTGELMPVMTKFARIAPSGLVRYRGPMFGESWRGNLFSAQFNSHRVQRHVLIRDGATFRTEDEDFLTATDPDFHPTDVIEDADGSLLVIDTGAWFIHGCPLSRVSRPQVRGGVYRIRRLNAPAPADPRGTRIGFEKLSPAELAPLVEDDRPVVRDRAIDALVAKGESAVVALTALGAASRSEETRCSAVFALSRIGTRAAREAVRGALDDPHAAVRVAAARMAGMARDLEAVSRLMDLARNDAPPVRRQAAAALGQIGDRRAAGALLAAAAAAGDRFVEHSLIYSLIQLNDKAALTGALAARSAGVRKAALIALDQIDGSPLGREQALAALSDPDDGLRRAALWAASHHPEWSGEVLRAVEARLRAPRFDSGDGAAVRDALAAYCESPAFPSLAARAAIDKFLGPERQALVLDAIEACPRKDYPQVFAEALRSVLRGSDRALRLRAVTLAHTRGVWQLHEDLDRIAAGETESDDTRIAALAALAARQPRLSEPAFRYLLGRLDPAVDAALRLAAAQVIGRSALDDEQLARLARTRVAKADPLILPPLLEAFRRLRNEQVGLDLVAALTRLPGALGAVGGQRLEELTRGFPAAVRTAARPLLDAVGRSRRARIDRLRRLESVLSAAGDPGLGRGIFFGAKAACSGCHTIGSEGGHVGPDLTAIGAIRSGHDLLEAIVLPSESFVPGHEVYRVETSDAVYSGMLASRAPDAVVLVTGPNDQVRIPRQQVVKMGPSPVSLMPEGFDEVLSPKEMADLLAFLRAQLSRASDKNRSLTVASR